MERNSSEMLMKNNPTSISGLVASSVYQAEVTDG